jgi:hypothetical protein
VNIIQAVGSLQMGIAQLAKGFEGIIIPDLLDVPMGDSGQE